MSAIDDAPPFLLQRLRRRGLFLVVLTLAGAAAGLLLGLLSPARYRIAETLTVVDPRPSGGSGFDYNLTPIRSYTALLSSPALATGCGPLLGLPAGAAAPAPRVRMPENTRLLEMSLETGDPARGTAFVRCVAEKAIAENRRLNEAQAAAARSVWTSAVRSLREELGRREAALGTAQAASLPRTTHSRFEAALDDVEKGVGGAATRAADLERLVSRLDGEIGLLERERDTAAWALGEAERREALSAVESAARAFDLVSVSPAVPPASPARLPKVATASLGGAAGLLLGAFAVLSAPLRDS